MLVMWFDFFVAMFIIGGMVPRFRDLVDFCFGLWREGGQGTGVLICITLVPTVSTGDWSSSGKVLNMQLTGYNPCPIEFTILIEGKKTKSRQRRQPSETRNLWLSWGVNLAYLSPR